MGKRKTVERFLIEAKTVHPELDFSLVNEYVNNNTKIEAICHCKDYCGNEHGKFSISPNNLLNGKGCPKCSGKGFTSEERKNFCIKKYDGKYDYSKSDFSGVKNKTIVICREHGEFQIDFDHHFNSNIGCPFCSYPSRNTESFKLEAAKIHKGFYNYDKTVYKNSHDKVIITCPIHGDFEQSPNAHLNGQGCPKCSSNRIILEETVTKLLENDNIGYIHNKRPEWLKRGEKGQLSLDFYIPDIKLGIECQGKQHFGLGGWSSKFNFEEQKERDKWKMEQCINNDVNLIYFANEKETPQKYIGEIFTSPDELMEYIRYLYKNKE